MQGQRGLIWHQIVLFSALILLTVVRLLTRSWQVDVTLFWYWLGAILGFVFIYFDQVYHVMWQDPEAAMSMQLRELFGKRHFDQGLVMILEERLGNERLAMRSVMFLAAWVILGIFTLTSVAAPFGRGFMFGLGLHLTFDLLTDYFGRGRDVRLWFWQIKRVLLPQEIVGVVWGYVLLFLAIGLFL